MDFARLTVKRMSITLLIHPGTQKRVYASLIMPFASELENSHRRHVSAFVEEDLSTRMLLMVGKMQLSASYLASMTHLWLHW